MTGVSNNSRDMILLFGMPRSGTTWIGKMFDSHPEVRYRHEPDSQFRLDDTLPLLAELPDAETYRAGLMRYCTELLPRCSPRTCGKQPRFAKQGETAFGRHALQLLMLMAKASERARGRAISWPADGPGRLVWKSIESLGRLGVLLHTFPASRGVMIVRDPRGYVSSVLRGEAQGRFLSADSIANDWGLFDLLCKTRYAKQCGIGVEALREESPERRLAWLWVLFNQKAMEDIAELPNGMMVRYEDLCAQPAQGFAQLFEFCGLNWNAQTQAFLDASTTQSRSDYYSVYKDPLASANKWQRELDQQQAEAVRELISGHPIGRWYLDKAAAIDP